MPKLTANQKVVAKLAIRISVPVVIAVATTVVANLIDKKISNED